MSNGLLMPKATAVWLVDNTTLTFEQIAAVCGMHEVEVRGIADGDIAASIRGQSPVTTGQMEAAELDRAANDSSYIPKLKKIEQSAPKSVKSTRRRYTPVSRRHDRPNAILWLLRNQPNLNDSQIVRLAGTTRPTIASIRDRSHWNYANLKASDPVLLGLCLQSELNAAVEIANNRAAEAAGKTDVAAAADDSLRPAGETERLG